jgi:hypothetical protein
MKHIVCLVLVGAAFGLDNGLGLVPQMVSVFAFRACSECVFILMYSPFDEGMEQLECDRVHGFR